MPFMSAGRPLPNGETTPMPVMTTRLNDIMSCSAACRTVLFPEPRGPQ
jgi:hypothetical protein